MDKDFAQALAAMVRSQNGRVGLSQTAAAAAIGVSDSAWQKWFKQQKRDVPIHVLIDLCRLWNVRLSDFLASVEAEQARLRAEGGAEEGLESTLSKGNRRTLAEAEARADAEHRADPPQPARRKALRSA